jgi:hypothetical protein
MNTSNPSGNSGPSPLDILFPMIVFTFLGVLLFGVIGAAIGGTLGAAIGAIVGSRDDELSNSY